MKKINYKGRCEKRKVSKCKDVCRTYSKIQSALVNELEKDEDVASFECNVCLEGVSDNMYSSDFVIKTVDSSTRVRGLPFLKLFENIVRNFLMFHLIGMTGLLDEYHLIILCRRHMVIQVF